MDNKNIAKILYQVADLLELNNTIGFEVIAYRTAARNVENTTEDISKMFAEEGLRGLTKIEGIGSTISKNIIEIIQTGKLIKLEKLTKKFPSVMLEINNIPGVGPKTTQKIYQVIKPKNINDLIAKLARDYYLKKLNKIGLKEKTIQNILENAKRKDKSERRISAAIALPVAEKFLRYIRHIKGVKKADIVGSLRRKADSVKDIDIIAAYSDRNQSDKLTIRNIIEQFTDHPDVKSAIAKGTTKASVYSEEGIQIDLEMLPLSCYGNLLQHFTGSKDHNIKLRTWAKENGFSVSEHGIKVFKNGRVEKVAKCKNEKCVYKTLGMRYIPPEQRQGTDEIERVLIRR